MTIDLFIIAGLGVGVAVLAVLALGTHKVHQDARDELTGATDPGYWQARALKAEAQLTRKPVRDPKTGKFVRKEP